MLDQIKQLVLASYSAKEPRGIFFSVFNKERMLVLSNGVMETDKPLETAIETLYHGIVEKKLDDADKIVVDVVTASHQETDMQNLLDLSLDDNGLFVSTVDNSKSGVLLPKTSGVDDVKQALTTMQKRFSMDGNVNIFVFQTERFTLDVASK